MSTALGVIASPNPTSIWIGTRAPPTGSGGSDPDTAILHAFSDRRRRQAMSIECHAVSGDAHRTYVTKGGGDVHILVITESEAGRDHQSAETGR